MEKQRAKSIVIETGINHITGSDVPDDNPISNHRPNVKTGQGRELNFKLFRYGI
jgi:hypothetical protein